MKATFSTIVRGASLLAGASLALTAVTVRGSDKPLAPDAFPTFESYIKVTGQAPSVSGDEKAFQRSKQISSSGGIGIEDLHFINEGKDLTTEINGKALTGTEDYLAEVKIAKNEFGSVDFGYKSFRTFYDGVGGFFPTNANWQPLGNRDLHVDRSKAWIEATVALPNLPSATIRYSNEKREGKKDSTIWGDTDFTGMPNNNPPISQVRKTIPSFLKLDEETKNLEFILKHTIGNTTMQLSYLNQEIDNLDTRFVTRFPNEVKPYPAPATTLLLPASQMNNQIKYTQGDGIDSKASITTFMSETKFNDQVSVKLGANYELLHATQSGDRSLVTSISDGTNTLPINTYNYQGLVGHSRILSYTGNASLTYTPTKNWSLFLAVKRQEEYVKSAASFNVSAASGTPATTVATTPRVEWANMMNKTTTPEVEVRYTGIKDVALYANYSKAKATGTDKDTSTYNPLTANNGTNALNATSESHGNYTIGANWKACAFATFRAELFKKSHQNDYVGFGAQVGDYYLLDSHFTGWKVTAIVKPNDVVTSTTRYIYQKGLMDVTGFLPTFPAYASCDAENNTVSETIDWTPSKQFYAQLNANIVFNTVNTVYPRAGITPASGTSIAYDTNQVLHNAYNNYVTVTALCGTTLTTADDLQFQVNYYKADNLDANLATMTVPYGMAVKEVSATVGIKHKFSDKLVGDAKVGYFDSKNDTTGGMTNFHGPQGYLSLTYAL